jgi:hypothetical protein
MLKVYLHAGDLRERNEGNILAILDIGYLKQEAFSDYAVGFAMKGVGAVKQDSIERYPRWAGSLWDLVARALTRILYRADQAPPLAKPDRRCAYATRLCASIEKSTSSDRGIELGTAEIHQVPGQRGHYTAVFREDILGERGAAFTYGLKSLNPADLLLRAICWAYFEQEVLGDRPALILPPSMKIDGVDQFDINALAEPAKTGFLRFMGTYGRATVEPMARAEDYVRFLMRG